MSLSQLIALAMIPKVSGGLSFLSSSFVIFDILKDPRKRQTTYHRLILGVSISDALSSLAFFLGTWVMPKGSTWGAVGSSGSCSFVGFFGQWGILGTFFYNAALATYYLLILKYNWSTTKVKKAEPCFHAFALLTAWSIGIYGLAKNLYGSAVYVCW